MVVEWDLLGCYPLVMTNIFMENHRFKWEMSLFLWPCSIAIWEITRRVGKIMEHLLSMEIYSWENHHKSFISRGHQNCHGYG